MAGQIQNGITKMMDSDADDYDYGDQIIIVLTTICQ